MAAVIIFSNKLHSQPTPYPSPRYKYKLERYSFIPYTDSYCTLFYHIPVEFVVMPYVPKPIDEFVMNVEEHQLGVMSEQCEHCSAFKFAGEGKGLCCDNGKVALKALNLPDDLVQLCQNRKFRAQARALNQLAAISSMVGAKVDHSVTKHGTPVYRVNGQPHHQYGDLNPERGKRRKFCQIYYSDGPTQDERRSKLMKTVSKPCITDVRKLLEKHNPMVQKFVQL